MQENETARTRTRLRRPQDIRLQHTLHAALPITHTKYKKHEVNSSQEAYGILQEVAAHVRPATYAAYLKARADVKEAQLSQLHQKQMAAFEKRLRKELADQVTPVRKLIIERVLTLHCPRCLAAFFDFDGCMALVCVAPGCKCAFCAVCLEDCGADAHGHVRQCKYTNAEGRAFGSVEDIPRFQRAWRIDKIREVRVHTC